MAEGERVLGGVGTSVILENDRVKIWEMDLAPGKESDEHRHDLDYILVILEGDKIAGICTDGRDDIYADVQPGLTVFVPKGGTEIARNVGTKRYREILSELKEPVRSRAGARNRRPPTRSVPPPAVRRGRGGAARPPACRPADLPPCARSGAPPRAVPPPRSGPPTGWR